MEIPGEFIVRDGATVVVRAATSVYGLEPVLKAAHKFTGRCYVHLEPEGSESVLCRLRAKASVTNLDSLAGDFCNELLDQALRARLADSTTPVRNLLLAQAFSGTNLVRPELEGSELGEDPAKIGRADADPH